MNLKKNGKLNTPAPVREIIVISVLSLCLVIACCIALMIGRYHIDIVNIVKIILNGIFGSGSTSSPADSLVVFKVRLPRILAAVTVGATLSAAGACYQNIFRNPMAEPSLLGVTAGSAFGAAIAILFSFSVVMIQITAFASGLVAVAATSVLSTFVNRNGEKTLTLLLCGIVTGTLFSAFLSLVKYVADPYSKLPAITYWLMGSLASVNMTDIKFASVLGLCGLIPLLLLRWRINAMAFGDDEAHTLGINTRIVRAIVICSSTLITAASVSISGMIGWIGLVIPHLARMLVGPSFAVLLPVSVLLGALFLLVVDSIARTVFSIEIPIGILTAIVGAPFFIALLSKGRKGWL
ncbi:MAG TPA: iron ABC transporter permease [Fibrobacteres bacterium]|jgi:iron complex transport system permease protein|nr:iron ABC transporter permease [Fibrobacterota bacterium]